MPTPGKKRLTLFSILLLLFVLAGIVPLPYTVRGPCVLEPSGVWYLEHDGAGQLITGWDHNLLDAGGSRVLLQFNRPDFVEVALSSNLREGGIVQAGDTIAFIASREGFGQLRVLEAEHRGAQVELDRLLAGARVEDIEVAEQSVESARIKLDAFQPEMERIREQYKSGVATLSLLQETDGNYDLLKAELRVAEAQLKALQAGAHPEEITAARVEIERFHRLLESTRFITGATQPVVTPTTGKVRLGCGEGVMLKIERVDTLAVITFLPEASLSWLKEGQPIKITLTATNSAVLHCQLNRIDFMSDHLTNQYIGPVAISFIDNHDGKLQTGMKGSSRMEVGSQTLLSFVLAKFGISRVSG